MVFGRLAVDMYRIPKEKERKVTAMRNDRWIEAVVKTRMRTSHAPNLDKGAHLSNCDRGVNRLRMTRRTQTSYRRNIPPNVIRAFREYETYHLNDLRHLFR